MGYPKIKIIERKLINVELVVIVMWWWKWLSQLWNILSFTNDEKTFAAVFLSLLVLVLIISVEGVRSSGTRVVHETDHDYFVPLRRIRLIDWSWCSRILLRFCTTVLTKKDQNAIIINLIIFALYSVLCIGFIHTFCIPAMGFSQFNDPSRHCFSQTDSVVTSLDQNVCLLCSIMQMQMATQTETMAIFALEDVCGQRQGKYISHIWNLWYCYQVTTLELPLLAIT